MADWTDKDTCFEEIESNYYWAEQERATIFENLPWIQEAITGGDALTACQRILWTLSPVHNAIRYLVDSEPANDPAYPLLYYLKHHSGVDWKSICEAWVKDDFEGKEWTIACIDHMRKLMWDEPFSVKWASKPEAEST